MASFNLPYSTTSKFLGNKEDVENLKYILRELDSERKIDLLFDREKVEELFLELNPQNFLKKEFRKLILKSTFGTKRCNKFLQNTGIDLKEVTDANKDKIITKAANFSWGPNKETRNFTSSFDINENTIPLSNTVDENIEQFPPAHEPYQGLFDYQSDIFFNAQEFLKNQNQRFIIQIPTGGGKTKVAMELVVDFLNKQEDSIVIWLVDRKELCIQAIDAFESIWKHKGEKTISLNRAWDDFQIDTNLKGSRLIVSTLSKVLQLQRKKLESLKADLIIFDEAHHAAAEKYSESIMVLSKPGTRVVGLTATPGRSSTDKEENKKLADMFDEKILQIRTSGGIGVIKYLQRKGILSNAKKLPAIKIPKLEKIFSTKELKSIENESDYSQNTLAKLAQNHMRNIIIAKKLLEIAKEGKQVLYFGTNVSQSKLMFAILKSSGFLAAHIESGTPKQFRKDVIEKFKKKKIQFLCNYEVLATGFDSPAVDVIVIARPTKSPILLLQMMGRGMRGPAVGGTAIFDLYYVKDAILEQFGDLDEMFEMFNEYYSK